MLLLIIITITLMPLCHLVASVIDTPCFLPFFAIRMPMIFLSFDAAVIFAARHAATLMFCLCHYYYAARATLRATLRLLHTTIK